MGGAPARRKDLAVCAGGRKKIKIPTVYRSWGPFGSQPLQTGLDCTRDVQPTAGTTWGREPPSAQTAPRSAVPKRPSGHPRPSPFAIVGQTSPKRGPLNVPGPRDGFGGKTCRPDSIGRQMCAPVDPVRPPVRSIFLRFEPSLEPSLLSVAKGGTTSGQEEPRPREWSFPVPGAISGESPATQSGRDGECGPAWARFDARSCPGARGWWVWASKGRVRGSGSGGRWALEGQRLAGCLRQSVRAGDEQVGLCGGAADSAWGCEGLRRAPPGGG